VNGHYLRRLSSWDGGYERRGIVVKSNENLLKEVKRELQRIHINGCRCNERLDSKREGSKRLVYTGLRFTLGSTGRKNSQCIIGSHGHVGVKKKTRRNET
jgi:hypothetical protein